MLCMNYKMLEYGRIDISEGINVNKTSASKECDIYHYWYVKDIGFKYELYLCNGCHDLMQKAMKFMLKNLWKNLLIYEKMMLLLFMLKEKVTEFTSGIWAKMMQLT